MGGETSWGWEGADGGVGGGEGLRGKRREESGGSWGRGVMGGCGYLKWREMEENDREWGKGVMGVCRWIWHEISEDRVGGEM